MAYIGKQPTVGNFVKLDAITTSATATYNLLNGAVAYSPQSANHCIVSLNGVIQSPTTSFTISGSTIVFASALTATDVIDFILVLGDVLNIGTPSDNTVSLAKLTATGTKDSTTFLRGDNTFQTIGANTPAFAVYLGSNQSMPNVTTTLVNFNTESFDTNNAFNTATYTFTVPSGAGGKYFFYVRLYLAGAIDGKSLVIEIHKNGASKFFNYLQNGANQDLSTDISAFDDAIAGDYYTVKLYHDSGSAKNLESGFAKTVFGGFKLIT